MKIKDYIFLKKLINESLEEMAFGKKSSSLFDDDTDVPDELKDDDTNSVKNEPISKDNFPRIKDFATLRKNSETQLDRKRSGLPHDENLLNAVFNRKNPKNNSRRDALEPDNFGRIKVLSSVLPKGKYEYPVVIITFVNIDNDDCKQIYQKFHKYKHTDRVNVAGTRQNNTQDGVTFIVPQQSINEWINEDFEELLSVLENFKNEDGSSKYFVNDADINNLRSTLKSRIVDPKDASDYFKTANRNNIELFNAFIEAESDESIQKFMSMYQRFGMINQLCAEAGLSTTFGHILSIQNASHVLGSGRLTASGVPPTFILTEHMWRTLFKRTVNPNASKFYIFVPNRQFSINKKKNNSFTSRSYTSKNNDGNDVDITSTEDVLNTFFMGKKWDELTQQQKISASVMCNYINPSNCKIIIEYDVSDTTLLDPNDDPFTNEMGLVNNFTGEFNKAAFDYINKLGLLRKGENIDSEKTEQDLNDGMNAFLANHEMLNNFAYNKLKQYCIENNIKYTDNTKDVSQSIISAMQAIARTFITLSKEDNIKILVNDAVYATCKVRNIALDLVGTLKRGKPENEIEVPQYINAFMKLNDILESNNNESELKQVDESINNIIKNPFKKYNEKELKTLALQMLPQNDNTLDKFNSLLERMEKSKNNLKY